MSNKNNIIKSELLSLYKKGKSESEAHDEISKTHSSYEITLNSVNKWFEVFKSKVSISDDYKATGPKKKFTDEYLISLVKDNPDLNIAELARLAGVSSTTILRRLKQVKDSGTGVEYREKSTQKFTDEYLIDLVNKNPHLNLRELSRIAGTNATTISIRIKQINSDGIRIKYTNKTSRLDRSESWTTNPKLGDEYLINLINNNPDLTYDKIAILTNTSESTISRRIKQINRNGIRVNYRRKNQKKFTDEFLVDLIDENPDFNKKELTTLADVCVKTISDRINEINISGKSADYVAKNHKHKFTDEYLIDLVNKNPDLNMKELAKLADTSQTVISRRIKEVINSGAIINYTNKATHKNITEPILTEEHLINLVNENPDLNMTELAKLAGVSRRTLSKWIKKINSDGEKVKYVKKRQMSKSK